MSPEHERVIVLAFYVPIVVAMVLETLAPRRTPTRSTARRWHHTAGLWLINGSIANATIGASALVMSAAWDCCRC